MVAAGVEENEPAGRKKAGELFGDLLLDQRVVRRVKDEGRSRITARRPAQPKSRPWRFPTQALATAGGRVYAVLKPGGSFVTFNYIHTWPLHKAKAFRKKVCGVFDKVSWRPVMFNVPPAFVVECRKGNVTCPCGKVEDCRGFRLLAEACPPPPPAEEEPSRVTSP